MMSPPGGLVGRDDAEELAAMLTWWRQQTQAKAQRPNPHVLLPGPDVYLARSPSGIPAMAAEAGTGTDSSIAQGSMSKDENCKLYRIDDWATGIDVDPIGMTLPVYNPTTTAIPANTLFLAVRDKPGSYVAVQLGASASGGGGGGGTTAAFSGAAAYNNGGGQLLSATPTKIVWTSINYDSGTYFDNANDQFLITEDGKYLIGTYLQTTQGTAYQLVKNSTTIHGLGGVAGQGGILQFNSLIKCLNGDVIFIKGFESAGPAGFCFLAGGTINVPQFWIAKIGS